MAAATPLTFEKAQVLCYRVFDVADEIDLDRARQLISEGARRLKLAREGSQYLQLPNPPLAIAVGGRSLALRGGPVQVEVTARVFDHGALSVHLRVPVPPGTTLEALAPLADELYDTASVEKLCVEVAEGLRKAMSPAMQDPHLWEQNESYTVIFAERIQGDPTAAQILARPELVNLMLGESPAAQLSERERYEVTQHHFSYTDRDLVVVDWNAAFVYEPSGSQDIPDILEICNAQLLELRYYDDQLDTELASIYDEIQRRRPRRWYSILRSPYRALARRVLATVLEMSEFIERVENSLKIIGDFYLAKVYEAGVRRLRISAWQASVTRKQQMLANVYQWLKGEVDTDRSLTLEATIVVLIIAEILMAIFSVVH
jgi:hypothetical protein